MKIGVALVALLAVASVAIGQVPLEDAQRRLEEKKAASTHPATQPSEIDQLRALIRTQAAELEKLRSENQKLRQEVALLGPEKAKPGNGATGKGIAKPQEPKVGDSEADLNTWMQGYQSTVAHEGENWKLIEVTVPPVITELMMKHPELAGGLPAPQIVSFRVVNGKITEISRR